MQILVTGSRGFIGKNLCMRLHEMSEVGFARFDRTDSPEDLNRKVAESDVVVHLAGENRPRDPQEYVEGNTKLTASVCDAIRNCGRQVPLILASSTQAELDNAYGRSKRAAETSAERLAEEGIPVVIYRLPGVFGKWCKPNYNSVVATFCHNIAHGLPVEIRDRNASLQLVYIDDVVDAIISNFKGFSPGLSRPQVQPSYEVKLGELANLIEAFRESRQNLIVERVGVGFTRALYSTYVSYLAPSDFTYDLSQHEDERGRFVEFIRTQDSGQVSYFSALPGVTRGRHYHHTKSEKFLVVRGEARFSFRNLMTDDRHDVVTSSRCPQVVETVPGWAHEITNVGEEEVVILVWANENYDAARPDTISSKVQDEKA